MSLFDRSIVIVIGTAMLALSACGGGGSGGGTPATAAKAWGAAQLIETNPGDAFGVQVASDGSGNAIAVWQQSDGTRNNIWSNRFSAGSGAWGTAQLIETGDGEAGDPQVAFDGKGNALAVWEQSDGTRLNIWANRFSAAGGAWGTAQLIETDNASDAQGPQIASDGSGNAIAVWQQSDGTRSNIWANRFSAAGGSWGTAQLIETDNAGDALNPQIAFDAGGNAVAVWQQSDGTRSNIWANRFSSVGGAWGAAQLIETDNGGDALNPKIAVGPGGNAIAAWVQLETGGISNIWANRFNPVGGWGTAELIEIDSGAAGQAQVAVDAGGNAIAVWVQIDPQNNLLNVRANRFSADSAAWGTPQVIGTDLGDANGPQIAFDASGNAVAIWAHSDGARFNVRANRFSSGAWGTAQLIETDNASDAGNARIAFDAAGDAVAVWTQSDGARLNIWANRFH